MVEINPWEKYDAASKVLKGDMNKFDVAPLYQENPNVAIGNPKTPNFFLSLPINEAKYRDSEILDFDSNILAMELGQLKDDSDWEQKVDKYDKAVQEDKNNQLDNPLLEHYYLYSYYYFMLRKGNENRATFFERLKNDPEITKHYFDDLRVCNLNLFPYQVDSTAYIKFNRDKKDHKYSYSDLESSKYVALLIIDRILNSEVNDKPTFIFKSYPAWSDTIRQALRERTGLKGQNLNRKYNLLADYFYEITSSDEPLANNHIHKVLNTNEYQQIKDSIWGE